MSSAPLNKEKFAGSHAGVVGGSIAGMLAARALSSHFRRVTVFERDRLPDSPAPRRGVPQSHHIHFVLARGREELERFFPTLARGLERDGAVSYDYGQGVSISFAGGWLPRFSSTLLVRSCTRPLLEWHVRRCLLEDCPNVEFAEETDAFDLLTTGDGECVSGVRVRRGAGEEEDVPLDFLVDAAGRQSRARRWLAARGYPPAPEVVVDPKLRYVCCLMEPPRRSLGDWKLLSAMPRLPDQPRSAAILEVEGGRWMASVATLGDDPMPKTVEEMIDFSRGLSTPRIHEALSAGRAVSDVYANGRTPNRWLRVDRLKTFPERFVMMGDCVCALNPIYGQGITLAALSARLLETELESRSRAPESRRLRGFGLRFQRKLARLTETLWSLAAGSDALWPQTEITGDAGLRLRLTRAAAGGGLMPRLMGGFLRVLEQDPDAARRMMEVMQLKRSPNKLMTPLSFLKVARESVFPSAGPQTEHGFARGEPDGRPLKS